MTEAHLIVITQSFPFDYGEEHFEDELPLLAQRFDRVTLVVQGSVRRRTRAVPQNCLVVQATYRNSWIKKIRLFFSLPYDLIGSAVIDGLNKAGWRRLPYVVRLVVGTLLRAHFLKGVLRGLLTGSKGPVVVYSYWFDVGALAMVCLKRSSSAIVAVARAHAYDIYRERHPFGFLPFQKEKFRRLDRIYFISDYGRNYCRQHYGLEADEKFKVARLGCRPVRGAAGLPQAGKIMIISVGSPPQIKRIRLMAESLSLLGEFQIVWTYVGEPLSDDLDRLLRAAPHVEAHFLGKMARTDCLRLLEEQYFDVMLHLSATEGIPVSMMECQAAGIPIIATNVGGISEIVQDGTNGILLPAHPTSDQVADAIKRFKAWNDKDYSRIRQNCIQRWQEHYAAEQNFSAFADDLWSLWAARSAL